MVWFSSFIEMAPYYKPFDLRATAGIPVSAPRSRSWRNRIIIYCPQSRRYSISWYTEKSYCLEVLTYENMEFKVGY